MSLDSPDTLHRFLFENTDVRGELVQLDATWQALQTRAEYPQPVRDVLGQALAAVSLLAATIKFDGSLIMQTSGDGPLHLLVVQATGRRTVRGLARWTGEVTGGNFASMLGDGRLVMTVDPGDGNERYQGIVGLGGESLSAVLQHYFDRSEQLPTRLWLHADAQRAAGLLLQRMPWHSDDDDAWRRSVQLADTVTAAEMLSLQPQVILNRLFHEETVRLFEGEPVHFACGCSRERVCATLQALGEAEVRETLAEQGRIEVTCEFCNAGYRFDTVDVEQLFAAEHQEPSDGTVH